MQTDLPALVAAQKMLPIVPVWRPIGNRWIQAASPLDVDGVTVEGLRLRGKAKEDLHDEAVTFQLEYVPPPRSNVKGGPLWRIEWRPLSSHNNKGLGPPELRFKIQSGSHHHPFDLNWAEQPKAVRRGNLPIAVPFPSHVEDTYEGLIAFVGDQFKIRNAGIIPIPAWLGTWL